MRSKWRSVAVACVLAPAVANAQQALGTDSLIVAADRLVQNGLRRYQIAGAALAIVRDGRVVHLRGFGYADVARGYRVDPDTTEFHIASVTKLVTAIAALQQVEAGRLDLRADVRPMLGALASGWRQRVTLHDLLTHTAGLDTRWIGIAAHRAADVRPLADYLPGAMPAIIDRPGSVVRYSNYGFGLVGRLVEIASGEPWGTYVERHVFAPLGMTRSYARPRDRPASHAVPYRYRRDTTAEPDVYEQLAPAGAVHSTAADLGRLVASILDSTSDLPVTGASKRFILVPMLLDTGVVGFNYGAFQYPNPHVAAASVGGEVPGFSTRLLLVPSLRLGVVLMVNRKDPTLAVSVFDSVLARVAPAIRAATECQSPATATSTHDIRGRYRSNAYDHESLLRIGALLGPTLTVDHDSDGGIFVVDPVDNTEGRWRQTGSTTWAGPAGECLAIVTHDANHPLLLSTRFAGPVMLERVSVVSNPAVVVPITAAALLMLVLILLADLVTALRSKRARHASLAEAPWLRLIIATLYTAFVVLFGAGLYQLAIRYDDRFAFGLPAWFKAVLVIPYIAFGVTVVLAGSLLKSRSTAITRRWRGWLVVLASTELSLVVYMWHATHR